VPDPFDGYNQPAYLKRRARHLRRAARQERAAARTLARATRTPWQQRAILDARLGTDQDDDGLGAVKERARLEAATVRP
jgi:hypothetical protein